MSSSHRLVMAALALSGALGGCALLGYDFDSYGPEGTGGGGSNASTSTNSISSAGTGGTGGGASGCNDCSSQLCLQDHACADAPPSGWNGPVALYFDTDPNFVCPAPFDAPVLAGGAEPMGAPVSCTPCTCDNQPCGTLEINPWSAFLCQSAGNSQYLAVTPGCVNFAVAEPSASVDIPKVVTGPGMCGANGGKPGPTLPAAFTKRVALCGTTQGAGVGCNTGSCQPKPSAPLDSRLCIYQTGALSCPTGYTDAVVFGTSMADTRGCSQCSCGVPDATCTVVVGFFGAINCQGASYGMFTDDNACHNLLSAVDVKSVHLTPISPCTPSQTGPIGGVGIKDPITVCCK